MQLSATGLLTFNFMSLMLAWETALSEAVSFEGKEFEAFQGL